ncbi:MAG: signal recognition particle-docking protein FtsY [Gammaproteobacteria bacterium]|nr:signal recognition particle-docking protein FtsY [Gammaproteobacteria bacterium]
MACSPQMIFGRKSESTQSPSGGFISRLRARLNRGDSWLTRDVRDLMPGGRIDENTLEELETRLLMADCGVETTQRLLEGLAGRVRRAELADLEALRAALKSRIVDILTPVEAPLEVPATPRPWVVLVVGVNGAGKTTTIGKLAHRLREQGLKVLLAAGDTFRAAAVEQLKIWGARNEVPVIAQGTGADPAAVIFDALTAARSRGIDVVLADTAGRLHNQADLMGELKKIRRITARFDATAPHETLLVLDASQGQNALVQARMFHQALGVTGLAITKLDGTARGGIVLAIANELAIPIRFIGIGEAREDLQAFNAGEFADALLGVPVAGDAGST